MRGVALAMLVVVLSPFAAPSAAATGECDAVGPAFVCAGDYGQGSGCAQPNSITDRRTGATASVPGVHVSAEGTYQCSHFCVSFHCLRREERGIRLHASAPVAGTLYGGWVTGTDGCSTYVGHVGALGDRYRDVGCVAGEPPDLPWGALLP